MRTSTTSPPRLAVSLLKRRMPDTERDEVIGDLTELFVNRVEAGRSFTRVWFWIQTLFVVVGFAFARPTSASSPRTFWSTRMSQLFSLRPALRLFRQDPGYALAFVVTLGLGIGATTAIFSAVEGVLIRPLPYPHADRIAYMEQAVAHGTVAFSFVEVSDYRTQSHTIDEFVEYGDWQFTVNGVGEPQQAYGGLVTANYFKVLAIRPLLGRTLAPDDDRRASPAVTVLTYEFWRRAFGSDQNVVGKVIDLSGIPTKVVGVLEPGSHYAGSQRAELYANYSANEHYSSSSMQDERQHRMTSVYALVKAGVPMEAARAEIGAIADRMHAKFPKDYAGADAFSTTLTPWRDVLVKDARPTLLVLMGAVALVLLVACANVGNLTLARLIRRERELAVRAALGASPARLRGQLLSEHLVLALAGSALGVLLASATLKALVDYTARLTLRADAVALDGVVLAFSLAVGVAAAVFFAWAPRLPSTNGSGSALTGASIGGRTTMGHGQRRMQRSLVATQVAVSFVALVGAGLLLRTFANLQEISPGFDATQVLALQAPNPDRVRTDGVGRIRSMFDTLVDRLRGYPGVVSVAVASRAPYDVAEVQPQFLKADGTSMDGTTAPLQMFSITVSPDYFSTLKIPLVRGRRFGPEDTATSAHVVLINQRMANIVFGDADPVGRQIAWNYQSIDWGSPRTVIGVVHDVQEIGGAGGILPTIYDSSVQSTMAFMFNPVLLIRTTGDPAALGRDTATLIHEVDPRRPVVNAHTLETAAADRIAPSRINAVLFSGFALLAMSIAAIGIGAVLAFSVSQRTREFGIRMALGSRSGQILTGVLREGLTIAGIGLALGTVAAGLLSRLLQRVLFEVGALDLVTFGLVGLLLLAVAAVASWLPARRATRVDPSVALRSS
jgi:predicted permease